jgi:hypothetical protein
LLANAVSKNALGDAAAVKKVVEVAEAESKGESHWI